MGHSGRVHFPKVQGEGYHERVNQNVGSERPMAGAHPAGASGNPSAGGAGTASAPGVTPGPNGVLGKTGQLAARTLRSAYGGAKALSGGLRAEDGYQREMFPKTPPAPPSATPLGVQAEIPMSSQQKPLFNPAEYTRPKVNTATGRYTANEIQAKPSVMVDSVPDRVGNSSLNAGSSAARAQPTAGLAEPKPTSLWGRTKNAASAVGNGAKSVASGSFLDANVGAVAKKSLRGAAALANGPGRVLAPLALAETAAKMFDTPTEEYAKRLGVGLTRFHGHIWTLVFRPRFCRALG